jgi:hypothetical protein
MRFGNDVPPVSCLNRQAMDQGIEIDSRPVVAIALRIQQTITTRLECGVGEKDTILEANIRKDSNSNH